MSNELIRFDEVSKVVKKNFIFDSVSFSIREHEILGILGYSGSGKTTLLTLICGLLRPDSGVISYYDSKRGEFISRLPGTLPKELIGYSTQSPSFYPNLSVKSNMKLFGKLQGFQGEELNKKIEDLLSIFNLLDYEDYLAQDLSEGMSKRLDLACALITSPKILVLDEPTANLDYKLRAELLAYIKKIHNLGVTVIFVSHFIEELEAVSSRVLFLHGGKIGESHSKNLRESFENFVRGVR